MTLQDALALNTLTATTDQLVAALDTIDAAVTEAVADLEALSPNDPRRAAMVAAYVALLAARLDAYTALPK